MVKYSYHYTSIILNAFRYLNYAGIIGGSLAIVNFLKFLLCSKQVPITQLLFIVQMLKHLFNFPWADKFDGIYDLNFISLE